MEDAAQGAAVQSGLHRPRAPAKLAATKKAPADRRGLRKAYRDFDQLRNTAAVEASCGMSR